MNIHWHTPGVSENFGLEIDARWGKQICTAKLRQNSVRGRKTQAATVTWQCVPRKLQGKIGTHEIRQCLNILSHLAGGETNSREAEIAL